MIDESQWEIYLSSSSSKDSNSNGDNNNNKIIFFFWSFLHLSFNIFRFCFLLTGQMAREMLRAVGGAYFFSVKIRKVEEDGEEEEAGFQHQLHFVCLLSVDARLRRRSHTFASAGKTFSFSFFYYVFLFI